MILKIGYLTKHSIIGQSVSKKFLITELFEKWPLFGTSFPGNLGSEREKGQERTGPGES
jgi:hypothetical protein